MPDDQNPWERSQLQLYRGDLLALTREWTGLNDEELRRRAVRAAGEKDVETLVSLTTAHLSHAGGSGVLTSPHTVKAYELGVRQFLAWATDGAVNLLRPGRHDGQSYVNALLAAGRAPAGVLLQARRLISAQLRSLKSSASQCPAATLTRPSCPLTPLRSPHDEPHHPVRHRPGLPDRPQGDLVAGGRGSPHRAG